jgi:hypothetical protein
VKEWLTHNWAAGILASVIAWIWHRQTAQQDKTADLIQQLKDEHDLRLRVLEADRVTRDMHEELRMSLMASITHSGERIEDKLGAGLSKVEGKVDDLLKVILKSTTS